MAGYMMVIYIAGLQSISDDVLEPICHLKTAHLRSHNPRLHSDETLLALSISSVHNPLAERLIDNVDKLRGCEELCVTRSHLLHLCRRRCVVSEMLKEPLSLLEEAGYVRLERKRDVSHRPALTVQLNPLAKLM